MLLINLFEHEKDVLLNNNKTLFKYDCQSVIFIFAHTFHAEFINNIHTKYINKEVQIYFIHILKS